MWAVSNGVVGGRGRETPGSEINFQKLNFVFS